MELSMIGSLTTASGIIIVVVILICVGIWIWRNNNQTESLKSIDQTFGRMLGENNSSKQEVAENNLRPWTCIHCGSVNPAIENFCEKCGKESQS